LLAAGVAVAAAISFLRVVAIAAALRPALLPMIAPPLLTAGLVAGAYAVASVYWRPAGGGKHKTVEFRNPFGFWSVVGFALLLGVVIVIGRVLGERLGATGAIVGAAAMGLADVDAVTVSMVRLVPQPLGPATATFAVLAAVLGNTMSKLAIGAVLGRGRFAVEVAAMSAACIVAGGIALWLALTFG
jgi:uncharacterized membrane protein (DUF4010 family)